MSGVFANSFPVILIILSLLIFAWSSCV